MKRGRTRETGTVKRKNRFVLRIVLVLLAVAALFFVAKFSYRHFQKKFDSENTVPSLYKYWEEKDYQKVYEISEAILNKNFLQNAARTFHGYSSFMLAVSQTDNAETQSLLDEAIINLRIALQYAKPDVIPQIEYMLGRSYFYKDRANNDHYYADLAIKYLLSCHEAGFEANDIFECLGLCYAALDETQKSIEFFSRALSDRESDNLLLSIAEQYCIASQGGAAKQYLERIKKSTQNDEILMRSLELLAKICMEEEDFDEAEKQFNEILEKNPRSGDAHYGLGLIYEKKGDQAKARAEWRRVINLDPQHTGARQKMSESR